MGSLEAALKAIVGAKNLALALEQASDWFGGAPPNRGPIPTGVCEELLVPHYIRHLVWHPNTAAALGYHNYGLRFEGGRSMRRHGKMLPNRNEAGLGRSASGLTPEACLDQGFHASSWLSNEYPTALRAQSLKYVGLPTEALMRFEL